MKPQRLVAYVLCGLLPFLVACSRQETDPIPGTETREAFSPATPHEVGISVDALEELASVVDGYVAEERVVGAELLVIADRRTVLHRTFGFVDRELGLPMPLNTLFNVRSMTKPLTGAAIQILIDEGRIALDDRVAAILPAFDRPATRSITVEQLLTHRSGLPLTVLSTRVDEYGSLQEMAEAAAAAGPESAPGSRFWYSDAGADVLGALVETVSGESLHAFITARILEPLGMTDSFYYIEETRTDPRAERIAPLYVTQGSQWRRIWTPDAPFYPFAWGSQGLYSTPADYARFLAMWLDRGTWLGDRLLSTDAVERTLKPASPMSGLGTVSPFPTGFASLTAAYGQMATLHVSERAPDGEATVIGHSGSDGTIGWAWPERDLIILLFTQSRGTGAPIDFEAEIDRLLLHPEIEAANAAARNRYAAYLGSYIPETGPVSDRATVVTVRNGTLALSVPGEITYELTAQEGDPAWRFKLYPDTGLSFRTSADGSVDGFAIHQMGTLTEYVRGEPGSLPPLTEEEVAALVGVYLDEEAERRLTVLLLNGELVIQQPESPLPLELHRPDADGWWALRLNPQIRIRFDIDESGKSGSFTVRSPEGESVRRRITEAEDMEGERPSG